MAIRMGIEFIGFIYTAVEQMPVPKISMPIEKKRFEILEIEGKWLNYAQLGRIILREQQKPRFNKFSCRM
jgi:spore germination protein GerM